MIVKIKKLNELAKSPKKGSDASGAYDVSASSFKISKEGNIVYKLGLAFEVPNGYRLMIQPRSSFTKKMGFVMANTPGIVDSDYRGEVRVVFTHPVIRLFTNKYTYKIISFLLNKIIPYTVGDRVAQIYIEKEEPVVFEETDNLSKTKRGKGGFGSTGK